MLIESIHKVDKIWDEYYPIIHGEIENLTRIIRESDNPECKLSFISREFCKGLKKEKFKKEDWQEKYKYHVIIPIKIPLVEFPALRDLMLKVADKIRQNSASAIEFRSMRDVFINRLDRKDVKGWD